MLCIKNSQVIPENRWESWEENKTAPSHGLAGSKYEQDSQGPGGWSSGPGEAQCLGPTSA